MNYNNNQRPKDKRGPELEIEAQKVFNDAVYQPCWITNEANSDLPVFANKVGKEMAKTGLTSSKIRSIYGEIKRIQMNGFDNQKAYFYLLKPKVAYAFGRENDNKGLALFKVIFDRASSEVKDAKTYNNFCNFMEAILAYHKYNVIKDK